MTSEPTEAFVWTWLPGADEPVVAGRIELAGEIVRFNYGRSYLGRHEAIPLYLPELPLRPGAIEPLGGLTMPGCIRDAGPDAWGQRVVMQHLLGAGAQDGNPAVFGPPAAPSFHAVRSACATQVRREVLDELGLHATSHA